MLTRLACAFALAALVAAPVALAGPPPAASPASPAPSSASASGRPAGRDPYRVPILRASLGAATSLEAAARGHRLVVVVMKGTWCPVCIDQLSRLAALHAALGELGALVVGLSTDTHQNNRATKLRHALPFDILSDPKHLLVESLGLWRSAWGHPLPSLLVYDRCGRERLRIEGRSPADRPERDVLSLLQRLDAEPERCAEPGA